MAQRWMDGELLSVKQKSANMRTDFMCCNFKGKTALSTGAASGMGLLFAQNFATLGGNVVLCDVNEQVLEEKVAEINAKGQGRAIGLVCDVRDYKQVCLARDTAVKTFGSIDVMANFAGGTADEC